MRNKSNKNAISEGAVLCGWEGGFLICSFQGSGADLECGTRSLENYDNISGAT